ncbi:MAG TPA: hypothetical protein VKA44_03640, partial [Gemmatimonadota bacterium]|nr:hypothetical protein [Gemmatimonadota bacterium]
YVLPDGTFAGAFTTRKLRVYPPHGGVGCLVLSERVPELVDTTRDVLSALGYHGFALVQYKRDATSGRYFLLEINCRHSTSGELAVRCGSNWPAVAHAALTGLDLPPVGQVEGRSWLDRERDRAAIRGYRELGEWAFGDGLRTLRTVRYGAFFAADDPGPALRFNLNRVRTRLQKSRHRRETAS